MIRVKSRYQKPWEHSQSIVENQHQREIVVSITRTNIVLP